MATDTKYAARDRAPAREYGVDGDAARLAVDLAEPATIETEIV